MDTNTISEHLLQTQREWDAAYRTLAAPRPRDATALRRRLLRLSVRILRDPFVATHPAGAAAARMQLRRRARTTEAGARSA